MLNKKNYIKKCTLKTHEMVERRNNSKLKLGR